MKRYARNALAKIRENGCWSKEFTETKAISSAQQLASFQEECVTNLLIHANCNVPYYTKILNEIGIIKNATKVDLSKFDQIPILTKEMIREQQQALVSTEYTTRKWHYNSSGGSTGEPVRFVQDDVYTKWGNASDYYWYQSILGIDRQNIKRVNLWGSWRDRFQGGTGWKAKARLWWNDEIILNSYSMAENDMRRYVKTINSYKPHVVRGYASALYEICRYIHKKNLSIYQPQVIVSSAETLNEEMREKIENVMGAKVYNFYGSREINSLAGECKCGLMHILGFHNIVEILDENYQSVKEGEEGRVVVTNLHNYSMPLIRYEIGDTAVLGPSSCQCGNIMPTLYKVSGRITDRLAKEDGTSVCGHIFTHLFFFRNWVKSYQIVQEDYKRLRIVVVLDGDILESDKIDIESKIKLVMGHDCEIIWEMADEIPKTSQGKYQYIRALDSNH